MSLYFWIFIGSGLGGMTRFAVSGLVAHHFGETFPWGTFIINVSGSFLIGFIAALTGPEGRIFAGSTARQFIMTGILGGYTTYSSFSFQTLSLARDGEWVRASANAFGTFALCFIAVWLGHLCAAWLNVAKNS